MLTNEMKARIAAAITDAHVEATGTPRVFVHVFLNELPPGVVCSAGESDNKLSGITGAIRAGRSLEVKQRLIKRISASWSEITGQSQNHLVAGLTELDPDIVMEYGLILPRPGAEKEWFTKMRSPSTESRGQDSDLTGIFVSEGKRIFVDQ
jgi:phenylpyruvate tautomerase PptA (4-oxalocrotonate tautomerase family)